jgi:hypothetical protein
VKPHKIETPLGVVYWRNKPTAFDRIGCDGLYVSSVRLSPRTKHAIATIIKQIKQRILKRT